jgi:hypothetical protein
MDGESSGARLDAVMTRNEIADLVNGYALNVRMREASRSSDFFTEDAVFETWRTPAGAAQPSLANRLEGREAVIAYITLASQRDVRVCPMIHNLMIEVSGCEAASTCVMAALTIPGGAEIIGDYQDTFRFDGRWRFASRKYTILLERPAAGPGGGEKGSR